MIRSVKSTPGTSSLPRDAVLAAGGASFLLLVAALAPAHLAHAHAGDPECGVCLHLDGNPVLAAPVFTAPVAVGAGVVASFPSDRPVPHAPCLARGRAPPVPVPVS